MASLICYRGRISSSRSSSSSFWLRVEWELSGIARCLHRSQPSTIFASSTMMMMMIIDGHVTLTVKVHFGNESRQKRLVAKKLSCQWALRLNPGFGLNFIFIEILITMMLWLVKAKFIFVTKPLKSSCLCLCIRKPNTKN